MLKGKAKEAALHKRAFREARNACIIDLYLNSQAMCIAIATFMGVDKQLVYDVLKAYKVPKRPSRAKGQLLRTLICEYRLDYMEA